MDASDRADQYSSVAGSRALFARRACTQHRAEYNLAIKRGERAAWGGEDGASWTMRRWRRGREMVGRCKVAKLKSRRARPTDLSSPARDHRSPFLSATSPLIARRGRLAPHLAQLPVVHERLITVSSVAHETHAPSRVAPPAALHLPWLPRLEDRGHHRSPLCRELSLARVTAYIDMQDDSHSSSTRLLACMASSLSSPAQAGPPHSLACISTRYSVWSP